MFFKRNRASIKNYLLMIIAVFLCITMYLALVKLVTPHIFAKSFMLTYDESMNRLGDKQIYIKSQLRKKLVEIESNGDPSKLDIKQVLEGQVIDLKDLDLLTAISNTKPVFIGGYARSGTTLMRAILDVHKSIACGPETKILPVILNFMTSYQGKENNIADLKNAGITVDQLNLALASFIYSILETHGERTSRLCAKDPDILYYMDYLKKIFPNSKFVYMVRDGRAAAYSLLDRYQEPKIFGKYKPYLSTWNSYNNIAYDKCQRLGPDSCLIVRYEDLILHREATIKKTMAFLGEEFSTDQLEHEKFIGDRIKVSETEWSTDQIKKPIYTDSLTTWIDKPVEGYDEKLIKYMMPMLAKFNYSYSTAELDYKNEVKNSRPAKLSN